MQIVSIGLWLLLGKLMNKWGKYIFCLFKKKKKKKKSGREFDRLGVWQHSFGQSDHKIFSMVILSLPLIQEGQLITKKRPFFQMYRKFHLQKLKIFR